MYILFIFTFFKIKFKYIHKHFFLLILFIGFTINVAITDVRFMNMLAIITACFQYNLKEKLD